MLFAFIFITVKSGGRFQLETDIKSLDVTYDILQIFRYGEVPSLLCSSLLTYIGLSIPIETTEINSARSINHHAP